MFVVTGSTGRTGGALVRSLHAAGVRARRLVRSPAAHAQLVAAGADVALGALDDPHALDEALAEAEGLYLVVPEDPRREGDLEARLRLVDVVAASVLRRRVSHVVLLSSAAAALAEGNGPAAALAYAERALAQTGARLSIVRAGPFQENAALALPVARRDGVYPSLLPLELALDWVASEDVGALAARCLRAPPRDREIIDLLGPSYTPRAIAAALGDVLGRVLVPVALSPAQQCEALCGAGATRAFAESVVELHACLASGRVRRTGDRTVHAPTPVEATFAALLAGQPARA